MSGLQRIPDPRERPWLTVKELAEISGEGEKAIRAAIDRGHLPVLSLGRYVRIPTAELLKLLGISDASAGQQGATSLDDDTGKPMSLRIVDDGDPPAA